MRARLIEYNFERGRDPKGKLGIGYGPAKPQYMEDFESAMDDLGIIIRKETLDKWPDVIVWTIEGPGDVPISILDKTIFLFSKPDKKGNVGWSFNPMTAYTKSTRQNYDTPYPIIKFIANEYHGDIEEHIRGLQDALEEYKGIQEKMLKWSKKWS
jgi:hypothetical protein